MFMSLFVVTMEIKFPMPSLTGKTLFEYVIICVLGQHDYHKNFKDKKLLFRIFDKVRKKHCGRHECVVVVYTDDL